MEWVALDQSLEYKLAPAHDPETLDWLQSIWWAGRGETTAWPKEGWKRILIEANQKNYSFFDKLMGCSLSHKTKRPLNSSSASRYLRSEHPFFITTIRSLEPLIWCLWWRKNSRTYRFIWFRNAAGPISFFAIIPNRGNVCSFLLIKRTNFFEEIRFPYFMILLNSPAWAILSFFVNLNDPSPPLETTPRCSEMRFTLILFIIHILNELLYCLQGSGI